MRAWAGIVLAVLAGGVLFFVTEGDDVAGELTSSRQSVYEIRPGDGIGPSRSACRGPRLNEP